MNDDPLRRLDLNLLRVFDALMRERKVAGAAERLGLSAPAVSNALARLRRALGDELFTRTPAGMQPTAHAQAIGAAVGDALASIGQAISERQRFEPARSDRTFHLAMSDIGEIHFLPTLLGELHALAPGVHVSTVRNTAADLGEQMAAGRVDLALGWLPDLGAGFFQRRLFDQRYVCLMAAGHPLAEGPLTLARFKKARHAAVVAEGTGHARVEALMRQRGVRRALPLSLPHFVAVPHIAAATDLVVTVPEILARRVAGPFGLAVRPHPVDLPAFAIKVFWHRRAHQDAGNRWLRELLFRRFGDDGAARPGS